MAGKLNVFILGPPRSGTSILYFALGDIFHLDGAGESHVMPIFAEIEERWTASLARFKDANVLASRLDGDLFRLTLVALVRQFYAGQFPSGNFVDKTPGPVVGVPFILTAFPDARVVLTRRTGVEVVSSHIAKFHAEFAFACRMWRHGMQAIVALRSQPPTIRSHILEVDQFDLTNAAAASAAAIAGHLGHPERAAALAKYFVERRVEQSSRHDWTRRQTLADMPWSSDDKRTFVAECGPMMETLGYPM